MKCSKARSILPELVSGELDNTIHTQAMEHIESCPLCQKEMLDYKKSMEALAQAWTPAQVPSELNYFTIPERQTWFSARRLSLAAACLALIAFALIYSVNLRRHTNTERNMTMAPPYKQQRETEPNIPPAPKTKPDEIKQKPSESEPAEKNEERENRWDERHMRPRKQWEYTAFNKRRHNSTIYRQAANQPAPDTTTAKMPELKPVAPVPPPELPAEVSCNTEQVPVTQKITKQIETYDRYGNKQITQVEVEEPASQPCMMVLY